MKSSLLTDWVRIVPAVVLSGVFAFMSISCGPTYPKEKLPEAVKSVCRAEYGKEVDVIIEGGTMGIYHSMQGLLDANMGINQAAWDSISSLILIASRVVLSTDADIQFYCVITQDAKMPEVQVVIIKHVNDVKLAMYRNISRGEAFKRTLFSMNLTPQAQKERSVEQIFGRMGLAPETRERVLDEFFRSPPTRISDIGYWRGRFYLKDVGMPEFLAEQISNRIKIEFRSEEPFAGDFTYTSSEGTYTEGLDANYFLINFQIGGVGDDAEKLREKKIRKILEIASTVVEGYRFEDFDFIVMNDQVADVRLRVDRSDVYGFDPRRTALQEIVQAPRGYFGF